MYDLVVHEKGSIVRQHIYNSGLARRLESTLLAALFNFRFDFVFPLSFGSFFFPEQSCWKSGRAPFGIEAGRSEFHGVCLSTKHVKPLLPSRAFM